MEAPGNEPNRLVWFCLRKFDEKGYIRFKI